MDNNDFVKSIGLIVEVMAIAFCLVVIVFVILEFFPGRNDLSYYNVYNGQEFTFQGNGEIYLEGKDCIILWKDVNVVSATQEDSFGIARVVINVEGQGEGQLLTHSKEGCEIRIKDLKFQLKANLLPSELKNILLVSTIIVSLGTTLLIVVSYLFNKFFN